MQIQNDKQKEYTKNSSFTKLVEYNIEACHSPVKDYIDHI